MLSLVLIAGLWTTTCIQTQSGGMQGYVQESYEISQTGAYEFTREWFIDPHCTTAVDLETEKGNIKLGKKLSGMFIKVETYEADFEDILGKDLGAIEVKYSSLRFARGMKNSSMRNTMTGLFEYFKK